VDEESFAFSPEGDVKFAHGAYCCNCFDSQISKPLQEYNDAMEAARKVIVFSRDQGKESRRYLRNAPAVTVQDCSDPKETLLRLAFLAAKQGFNGLVNADVKAKKVKINFYNTSVFSGSGIPTQIDEAKLERMEKISTWVKQT
jgi:hypothetical protein